MLTINYLSLWLGNSFANDYVHQLNQRFSKTYSSRFPSIFAGFQPQNHKTSVEG
jgi:hypothetical protein